MKKYIAAVDGNVVRVTNVETGEVSQLVCHTADTLHVGGVFRLIGHTRIFRAVALRTILGDVLVVDGESLDGRFRTTARVVDTCTAP